jgi:hypothetical protein
MSRFGNRCSWEIRHNLLICNDAFSCQLGKILCKINIIALTLNKRVQGSSPCAPTNKFEHLPDFHRDIFALGQFGQPTENHNASSIPFLRYWN